MIRLVKIALVCAVLYIIAAQVLPGLAIVKDAKHIVGVAAVSTHHDGR